MATIIAAVFDTKERAERAARRMLDLGVPADAIDTFQNNPPGQHAVRRVGGDEKADPEAHGLGRTAVTGAAAGLGLGGAAGALVAGPIGAVAGAAVGAYVGSLAGGL